MIDSLGKTTVSVDEKVVLAGERLASVQGGLASRVEEFQRALGAIASQVATLGRLSTTTQADAGALSARLSQQADSLAAVARELAQQRQSLDAGLENRRNALQTLVGELAGRGEAFESVLSRFAGNVEESFTRAQARAPEIAASLASATKGASVAVVGQFETIRDTAAKERERTAQSLRAAIEQTNGQLSSVLDSAAERFRQSVDGVKEMASQVQRELEATRQELRRGVLELPQETTEATEAMRRVVSDQIRALKELASLVTESNPDFDVAEPERAAPQDRREQAPIVAETPRNEVARAATPARVGDSALAPVAEPPAARQVEPKQIRRAGAAPLAMMAP